MAEKETVADPVTPEGQPATIGDLDQMTERESPSNDYGGKNDDGKGVDHSSAEPPPDYTKLGI